MRKIVIVSNTSWSLCNYRIGLLRSLKEDGWEVVTAAPEDDCTSLLKNEFRWIPIVNLSRRGFNPFQDLRLLWELRRILLSEKPDLVLSFTIKPNIYSGMAARLTGTQSICSVTGLGYMHNRHVILSWIVTLLYRFAFRFSARIGFQNMEDIAYFTEWRIIKPEKAFLTPGSGVDLERFAPHGGTAAREDSHA